MSIDFGNLLGLADGASATLSNALSVFTRVQQLAQDGVRPKDIETALALSEHLMTLSSHLSKAQMQMSGLKTELDTLQRAQRALDEFQQRKRNYVLSETPVGERIYRLKDDADTGEPPHEVCPACFERHQIRILQPRGTLLECDECKATYRTEEATGGLVAPGRVDWSGYS